MKVKKKIFERPRMVRMKGLGEYLSTSRNDNLKLTPCDNPILTPLRFN